MKTKEQRQSLQDRTHQPYPASLSRRGFLKAGAALGTAMCIPLTSQNVLAAEVAGPKPSVAGPASITKRRTLGSAGSSMEVSALGFGVMGMNYNRGLHPDRKALIELLHQAAERGVTLFDTAETYGPSINEELAGEALSPYRGKVAITTKFGHDMVNRKHTGGTTRRPDDIRK